MSGLFASVLLRSAFTPADTSGVTELLRRYADEVTETRKGRHWTFVVNDAVGTLSVLNTAKHPYDFEIDMIENGLDFDDAPDAFVLAIPTRRECDLEVSTALIRDLANIHGGIACGKHS